MNHPLGEGLCRCLDPAPGLRVLKSLDRELGWHESDGPFLPHPILPLLCPGAQLPAFLTVGVGRGQRRGVWGRLAICGAEPPKTLICPALEAPGGRGKGRFSLAPAQCGSGHCHLSSSLGLTLKRKEAFTIASCVFVGHQSPWGLQQSVEVGD